MLPLNRIPTACEGVVEVQEEAAEEEEAEAEEEEEEVEDDDEEEDSSGSCTKWCTPIFASNDTFHPGALSIVMGKRIFVILFLNNEYWTMSSCCPAPKITVTHHITRLIDRLIDK